MVDESARSNFEKAIGNLLPTNCKRAAWVGGVPICRLSTTPCSVYYGATAECEEERMDKAIKRLAESFKKARENE